MTDFAHDRKSIRRKEKAARLADVARREITHSVMSTPAGRQWMWDLLSSCHIFATTFAGDPLQSAFAEGQRNVGLSLLADIMIHCPDQYIQAMRESNERHISNDSATDRRSADSGRDGDPDGREGRTGVDNDYDPFGDPALDDGDEARPRHDH